MEMDLLRVKVQASATNEALIKIEANVIHTAHKALHDPNLPPIPQLPLPTTCNPSCISFQSLPHPPHFSHV